MEPTSSLPRATCEPTAPQPIIQIPTVGASQTEHEDGRSTIYSGLDRDRFSPNKQREKRAIQKLELHHLEQRLKMAQLQARETKKRRVVNEIRDALILLEKRSRIVMEKREKEKEAYRRLRGKILNLCDLLRRDDV